MNPSPIPGSRLTVLRVSVAKAAEGDRDDLDPTAAAAAAAAVVDLMSDRPSSPNPWRLLPDGSYAASWPQVVTDGSEDAS